MGTLPKYDELNIESAYRFFIVAFGEGRVGQLPNPEVEVRRGRY